eukprot:scaffold7033_cov257-Pinguiococcus_pyrenoidosus.AAC.15
MMSWTSWTSETFDRSVEDRRMVSASKDACSPASVRTEFASSGSEADAYSCEIWLSASSARCCTPSSTFTSEPCSPL